MGIGSLPGTSTRFAPVVVVKSSLSEKGGSSKLANCNIPSLFFPRWGSRPAWVRCLQATESAIQGESRLPILNDM